MLRHDLKIFENKNIWEQKKHLTLFKNKSELNFYQNYFLKIYFDKINYNYESINLSSSGTSGRSKKILFPKKFYENIENHHIWRIMNSHKIDSGNVISIFQGGPDNNYDFVGPKKIASLGLMNNSWSLFYNPKNSNSNFWKSKFEFIKKINPSFLYASPSVFVSILENLEAEKIFFNFPIIFSCETLTDQIRKKANNFFSKVIDKMMDWSTGFGFFECEYGVKHVYDEIALVNQQEKNSVVCTSLFNYFQSPNKLSDDFVVLEEKKCKCGIYGKTLKEFEGKIFECLVSKNGHRYSANYVCGALGILPFQLVPFEIIQKKDLNIEFSIKNKLSDSQLTLVGQLLGGILLEGQEFSIFFENRCIKLTNSNNFIRFIEKEPKIYRNKILTVRSLAITI